MNSVRKVAREVAGKAELYSMRLKVIEKRSGRSQLGNPITYEIITFQDVEGTNLECILYNEEIQKYTDIIEDKMFYEIFNPIVIALLGDDVENADDQVYRITFNKLTTVQPILEQSFTCESNYQFIASIPRRISLGGWYDVLGIILYVNTNCQVPRSNGQTWDVGEVVIVDQSSEQVITVTAWEATAIEECRNLQSLQASFPVVGFTNLRASSRKGFSLSTTQGTVLDLHPLGRKADLLHNWRQTQQQLLAAKQQQVLLLQLPQTEREIITLAQLHQKKVGDTLQEEAHWIKVNLDEFDSSKIHLYLGCSNCSIINNENIGAVYTCTRCLKQNVISTPRMRVTFWAADESATHVFTASDENAEELLEVEATTLYSMSQQEREYYFPQMERQVRANPVYIQVVPSSSLARYRKLFWVLQKVSLT